MKSTNGTIKNVIKWMLYTFYRLYMCKERLLRKRFVLQYIAL